MVRACSHLVVGSRGQKKHSTKVHRQRLKVCISYSRFKTWRNLEVDRGATGRNILNYTSVQAKFGKVGMPPSQEGAYME